MLIIVMFYSLHCETVTAWRVIARTDFVLMFWITIMKAVLESKVRRVEMCPLFCLVCFVLHQCTYTKLLFQSHYVQTSLEFLNNI